jgi:hypothetical protein
MVATISPTATERPTWRPDITSNETAPTTPNNTTGAGVVQTLGTGPTANPTTVTAADTRNMVNADPRTQQLRGRIEQQLPAEGPAGEADDFPADGSLDDAKKFVEAHPLQGNDPNAWSQDQREAFNVIAQDFGARHAEHHHQWHTENGSGGTRGAGSGEQFLQFHRDLMRQFTAETGLPVPSGWDPSTPVPAEFTDPAGTRDSSDPKVSLPAWLTPDGTGTEQGNKDFGQTVTIDGTEYKSLSDFKTPDELGRALGESGYHASVHNRMGGTMGTLESPKDATFYAWHGHVDELVDRWLATDSGKAWAAANPNSPLLNGGGSHDHHSQTTTPAPEPRRRGGTRAFAI